MSLEMHAGNANVVVAEHRDGEMMVSTFSSNLEAVLTLMDRGRLGGGPYGCQEHRMRLMPWKPNWQKRACKSPSRMPQWMTLIASVTTAAKTPAYALADWRTYET